MTVKAKLIKRIRSAIKWQEMSDEDFKEIYGITPDELEAQSEQEVLDIYDDITMPC